MVQVIIKESARETGRMANSFVQKLEGYGRLTSREVAVLAAATANPRNLAARQDLIREGDRSGPVFVVIEGWACRYKILPNGARQVLAYLMPGDSCDLHLGLLAAMDHGRTPFNPHVLNARIGFFHDQL